MAQDTGTFGLSTGTGSKVFTIGMNATWMQIFIQGSGLQPMKGFIAGGFQYCYSDSTTASPTTKAIQVRNTAGTVVLEGTWTSFASNQVTFNITTNTLGASQSTLIFFGN